MSLIPRKIRIWLPSAPTYLSILDVEYKVCPRVRAVRFGLIAWSGFFSCNSAYKFLPDKLCRLKCLGLDLESRNVLKILSTSFGLLTMTAYSQIPWDSRGGSLKQNFAQKVTRQTIVHALGDCPPPRQIWEFSFALAQSFIFLYMDPNKWIQGNLNCNFYNILFADPECPTVFLAPLWSVWEARNMAIFEDYGHNTREVLAAEGLAT